MDTHQTKSSWTHTTVKDHPHYPSLPDKSSWTHTTPPTFFPINIWSKWAITLKSDYFPLQKKKFVLTHVNKHPLLPRRIMNINQLMNACEIQVNLTYLALCWTILLSSWNATNVMLISFFLIFQKLNDKLNVIFSKGTTCTNKEKEEIKQQFVETHRRIDYYSQRLEIYQMKVETLHAEFFQQFVCLLHRGQKILPNGNLATITPYTLVTLCRLKIKSWINLNFAGQGHKQIDRLDIPKSLKRKLKKSTSHKTKRFANSSANKMGRYKERNPIGLGSCWALRTIARTYNPKCDRNWHWSSSKDGILQCLQFANLYYRSRSIKSLFFLFIMLRNVNVYHSKLNEFIYLRYFTSIAIKLSNKNNFLQKAGIQWYPVFHEKAYPVWHSTKNISRAFSAKKINNFRKLGVKKKINTLHSNTPEFRSKKNVEIYFRFLRQLGSLYEGNYYLRVVCVLPSSGAQTRPYWGDIVDVSVPSGPTGSRTKPLGLDVTQPQNKKAYQFLHVSYLYFTQSLKVQKLVPIDRKPCKSTSLDLCIWRGLKIDTHLISHHTRKSFHCSIFHLCKFMQINTSNIKVKGKLISFLLRSDLHLLLLLKQQRQLHFKNNFASIIIIILLLSSLLNHDWINWTNDFICNLSHNHVWKQWRNNNEQHKRKIHLSERNVSETNEFCLKI